jgi:hypothetical protein
MRMILLACVCAFAIAASAQTAHYRHDGKAPLNDLKATPGATNPILTEAKVCSKDFRTGPYRKVEESTKHAACKEYGLSPDQCTGANVEIDHLISLELGGSNDLANLWPEPYSPADVGARVKDQLEDELHREVCAGKISLPAAQKCIATDWWACGKKLGIYK